MIQNFWDLLSAIVKWRVPRSEGKPPLGMEATDIDFLNKIQAENERLEQMNGRN